VDGEYQANRLGAGEEKAFFAKRELFRRKPRLRELKFSTSLARWAIPADENG
jgi:hypothetical protein